MNKTKCPVCEKEYDNVPDYCTNEKCFWEFKKFFGELSDELEKFEKIRLKTAKENYQARLENNIIKEEINKLYLKLSENMRLIENKISKKIEKFI